MEVISIERSTYEELLTGIDPDEPLGIPSEKPARWMLLAWAMAIQECGEQGLNVFEMLRGWGMR